MTNATLEEQLQNHGLKLLSVIQQGSMLTSGQSLVLIGNSSKGMWPAFSQSEEYKLGKSNPLDRWSKRLGQQLANQYGGRAIYPFTGPPYQPFLSWAQHNGDSFQSPLGLHIHHQYGLWHGYRFGLILDQHHLRKSNFDQPKVTHHPCSTCIRPCMQACPVNAFTSKGYDVVACRTYVQQNPQTSCAQNGCAARLACPVGPVGGYVPEQHQYHMAVFARQV